MERFRMNILFFRPVFLSFCFFVLTGLAAQTVYGRDKLVESSDYKDKDFKKGCISDYSDLEEGEDISWVWVAPGIKLTDYKVVITSFDDISEELKKTQLKEMKELFKETFETLKGTKGTLNATVCIYEIQKFSAGKAWIPFAGGHQMQAGLGAEVILKTSDNKVVAKFRHFAREGAQVEQAAEEVADDLKKFIKEN